MNIYVGNVSPMTSVAQLRRTFEKYGVVEGVNFGSAPRDQSAFVFCFVAMPSEEQAAQAVKLLNGTVLNGHMLTVKESGVAV